MPSSVYAYQHYLLRSISAEFKLPETKQLALQPGVQAVYRVTCYYPDENLSNSVGTLVSSLAYAPILQVHYDGSSVSHESPVAAEQLKGLSAAFSALKFDKLEDQPGIPARGVTLWLVERAAGSFLKSVLVAPELASEAHQALISRLQEFIPQAVEATHV